MNYSGKEARALMKYLDKYSDKKIDWQSPEFASLVTKVIHLFPLASEIMFSKEENFILIPYAMVAMGKAFQKLGEDILEESEGDLDENSSDNVSSILSSKLRLN